jgi:hypothetical protein
MTDPYRKICKYKACGKPFTAKRMNQEYCPGDCKKKENNGKARLERQVTKPADQRIKKNRRILEQFFNSNITEVTLRDLEFQGFNHLFSTSRGLDDKGGYSIPHYMNYSLKTIGNNKLKIEKLW